MARSTEALQRRALKRNRTVQEQQQADLHAAKKQKRTTNKQRQVKTALMAPGSWTCPSCQQVNFPSRYVCRGANCPQERPAQRKETANEVPTESRTTTEDARNNPKDDATTEEASPTSKALQRDEASTAAKEIQATDEPTSPSIQAKPHGAPNSEQSKATQPTTRHDPATSKQIHWSAPQADTRQIQHNTRLRLRFLEHDPSLTAAERERAQILLARDERKKEKKQQKKKNRRVDSPAKAAGSSKTPSNSTTSTNDDKNNNSNQQESATTKSTTPQTQTATQDKVKNTHLCLEIERQSQANATLLREYSQNQGTGMSDADMERAQQLLARQARKQQTRQEKKETEKKPARQQPLETGMKVMDQSCSKMEHVAPVQPTAKGDLTEDDHQPTTPATSNTITPTTTIVLDKKEQKKQDKKLRKQLEATGGKGMTAEEMSRAKSMVAKKERKKQRKKAKSAQVPQ